MNDGVDEHDRKAFEKQFIRRGIVFHLSESLNEAIVSDSGQIGGRQELLLIRHATTDMNGTFCGQSDPPLNAMGRAQASTLAMLLRNWNVRRLYASDLQRAVQTAEPLAKLWHIPIALRSALREVSFGEWEGKSWSQIRSQEPDIKAMESAPELCAPGGEAFACFHDRVLRGLKEILVDCDGHLTAIVTHLGVMRVVLKEVSAANSVWEASQRIDHCSIYRIRVDRAFLNAQY